MIVVDTHIWYWWINQENQRLSDALAEAIERSERVGVSPVSCYELALAHQRGRVALPLPPAQWFELALGGSGIELLPLNEQIALGAVNLSDVHRDPFDRIIIATAIHLDARLASVDGHFGSYPELEGRLISQPQRHER